MFPYDSRYWGTWGRGRGSGKRVGREVLGVNIEKYWFWASLYQGTSPALLNFPSFQFWLEMETQLILSGFSESRAHLNLTHQAAWTIATAFRRLVLYPPTCPGHGLVVKSKPLPSVDLGLNHAHTASWRFWIDHFTSLSLSHSFYKMGTIKSLPCRFVVRADRGHPVEAPSMVHRTRQGFTMFNILIKINNTLTLSYVSA